MIPFRPRRAPDTSMSDLARIMGTLVDKKIAAGQQVEYATEGRACDGLPILNFLNARDCAGDTTGPLVLATRMQGKPVLISRPSGVGTSSLPPVTSSSTVPAAAGTGRIFLDAVGSMYEGRNGTYFPRNGRATYRTNGAYLGIAPAGLAVEHVYPGSPVTSGSGTWMLDTGLPFSGDWVVSGDHFLLANPGHDPITYAGMLFPAPFARLWTANAEDTGRRFDWIRDASGTDRYVGRLIEWFGTPGFQGGPLGWWMEGTDVFFAPGLTLGWVEIPHLTGYLCGGPTPMVYGGTGTFWPAYLGLSSGSSGGFRKSDDLVASIEGNDSTHRATNRPPATSLSAVLTLTIRESTTLRRIASCPLPEVTSWIMGGGPSSRFSAERAAGYPSFAGVRVFPVSDGTFVVTVKDCTRAWVYEVSRSPEFLSLQADPEPLDVGYPEGGYVLPTSPGAGASINLDAMDGTTGKDVWISVHGGYPTATVCTGHWEGSNDGGATWHAMGTFSNPTGTPTAARVPGYVEIRCVIDTWGSGSAPSATVTRAVRTFYPWDSVTCVRLLETVDLAGVAPVGFVRAAYL